jgi:hypothetical protein
MRPTRPSVSPLASQVRDLKPSGRSFWLLQRTELSMMQTVPWGVKQYSDGSIGTSTATVVATP